MKTLFLILCTIIVGFNIKAQTAAIQFDKENILYINEDNPLTVVAEGYSCKQLVVTTANGTIKGKDGHYVAHPDHVDPNMTITVKVKTPKGLKELCSYGYRVKYRPDKKPE